MVNVRKDIPMQGFTCQLLPHRWLLVAKRCIKPSVREKHMLVTLVATNTPNNPRIQWSLSSGENPETKRVGSLHVLELGNTSARVCQEPVSISFWTERDKSASNN